VFILNKIVWLKFNAESQLVTDIQNSKFNSLLIS